MGAIFLWTAARERTSRLVLVSALAVSCAPTAPNPWRGYATIDSYASSGRVRLYWSTTTDPGCVDYPCPPPGPDIARVVVLQSSSGPSSGWHTVAVRTRSGSDSTTIGGLKNDALYWFRVVALDVAGRQLLESSPIVTMPGSPAVPSLTLPLNMSGRFSWSPGGDSIAFVDASVAGEYRLAILDIGASAVTHLVTYPWDQWAGDAIWSHDGSTIVYARTPTLAAGGIDYRIWSFEPPQGTPEALTAGRVDFDPAWGGGGWLYFCRGTPGPPNIPQLWRVMPGDPSSMQALTADPDVYKYSPSVRLSDDWVVYEGRPDGSPGSSLFAIRPGRSPVALTRADWYRDSSPSWSPDGQHVVFASTRSGHSEVWSVRVATGALRQLTRETRGSNWQHARWSPDSRRLAVFEGRAGGWSALGRLHIYEGLPPLP